MASPTLATALILRWLTSRLGSDTELATLIGGRIEINDAGEGMTFPYILITIPDPARPFYVVGARAVTRNGVYLVRGVEDVRTFSATLEAIAKRIVTVLDNQRDEDAGIVSSILAQEYAQSYTANEHAYCDLGGIFEISAEG